MSDKGIRKPRLSEYGNPHAVRFRKSVDRALALICLESDTRPSTIIQAAVECFLTHPDCISRRTLLENKGR